jgi:polyketide synthase PksN
MGEANRRSDGITAGTDAPTPTAAALAEIWAAVFEKKQVGIDERFADLGGDSITAAVIITRIQESLGIKLQLTDLIKAQTVRKLSEHIEAIAPAASS